MTPKYKFAEGERMLCFHGPLIYEGKVLRAEVTKSNKIEYYIHYTGWSKNWDEWVPEHLVLKYNERNVERQKELSKEHAAASKKKRRKTKKSESSRRQSRTKSPVKPTSLRRATTASNSSKPATSCSHRRRSRHKPEMHITASTSTGKLSRKDMDTPQETKTAEDRKKYGNTQQQKKKKSYNNCDTSLSEIKPITRSTSLGKLANDLSESHLDSPESESKDMFFASDLVVNIEIPMELKRCLADNWRCITCQGKLMELPAKLTVQHIVEQYLAVESPAGDSQSVAIADVVAGIVAFFDVLLSTQLLYKCERPQYAVLAQQYPTTPPSQLYGAVHLLRLFVILGSKLRYSAFDEQSMQNLLVHIQDFLKFLAKNAAH